MQSNDENFTGERFVPGIEDKKLEIEHFQRYFSIQKLVNNRVVLDAACGEGYGSSILAETALQVYGIDIDEGAISRAKENYETKRDNLEYAIGDIRKLALEDKSVDVVVSFETIEHVDGEMQESFLREIKRVLKPEGILIMSTPNKAIYSDRYNYKNEFHVKEFYCDEFETFLKQQFKNVRFYGQSFQVVSLIDNLDEAQNDMDCFGEIADKAETKYYIAVASDEDMNQVEDISSLYKQGEDEYENQIQRILVLQNEEQVRNEHIFKLDTEIEQKNKLILDLQKNQEEQKVAADTEIASWKKKSIEQEAIVSEQANTIAKQETLISEHIDIIAEQQVRLQDQALKIQEHSNMISKEQLMEAEKEIVKRGEHILKQDAEIEFLRRYRLEAEREFSSKTYRLSYKLRLLSVKLLPPGSTRRVLIAIVARTLRHPIKTLRAFSPKRIKGTIKIIKSEGLQGVYQHYVNTLIKNDSAKVDITQGDVNSTQKSFEEYMPLEFKKFDNPEVSIIIPVYNQFDYTYRCLESILRKTGDISYEIIIADDNSQDDTSRMEEIIHQIIKVTNKENLRFLRNCNNAAKKAKGKYILFLNNDTQVQDNWLLPMVKLMKEDSNIGLTGAKLIYADGRLQEAGGIVWKDASAWNYGNCQDPEDAEFNYVKNVDFISGACILIRRELWENIGGFDEALAPAYYEDVDLAFEVRKRGFQVVYQPQSAVVHYEGVSNGTDLSDGQKVYQTVNQKKFYEKWKAVLEKEHFENGQNVFLARDRSRFKKHILVVDHYVPHFDKDAGGRGTFMYLKLFKEMGMQVIFLGDNFYKHEPYSTLLNQEGIEILYGAKYMNTYEWWIKEYGQFFEYIYLQRPHIAVKYMDLVKKYTNAKIIYYDVDLCHVREMRQYEITKDEALLKSAKKWKKIEFDLIDKADVVHVVGSYEEEYLQQAFSDKIIRNIPLYIYSDIKRDVNKDFVQRKNILFVGGFGHPPNEDAVLWFAENVFPSITRKYPNIKWYIVGSNPTENVVALANENIIVKGFVSDEELNSLYSECRIDVVPLRYGAGVKGKVLEAIYNQIPLVTTSVGAEGLSKAEDAYWMVDEAEQMIRTILDIYDNPDELMKKSENCKQFILNHFTINKAKEVINLDFD